MKFASPTPSAKRFFEIAEALCWAVGKAIRPGFIEAVMAMVVVRRIQRVRGMLLALEARWLAGWMPGVGRPLGSRDRVVRVRAAALAPVRLPRAFGWLCRFVPGDAACYAGQLRVVLAEPGMVALLAACPQAVRAVRPLCRMLGIAPADYVPGEGPVVVAEAAVPVPSACRAVPGLREAPGAGRGGLWLGWGGFDLFPGESVGILPTQSFRCIYELRWSRTLAPDHGTTFLALGIGLE